MRSVDAFDERELTGTAGAAAPFWSPRSDAIAFVADGKLKTVSLTGGAPEELASGVTFSSQGAMPGNWNRDGMLAYSRINLMWMVSSKGGESTPLTTRNAVAMDENHYGLFFLPDARHFLMLVRGGVELRLEVVVGEIGSSARTTLLRDVTSAQYAPGRNGRSGHVLFVRDGKLIARPFDMATLQLTGSEVTLAQERTSTCRRGCRSRRRIRSGGSPRRSRSSRHRGRRCCGRRRSVDRCGSGRGRVGWWGRLRRSRCRRGG